MPSSLRFPPALRRQRDINRRRIAGKPYSAFFDDQIRVDAEGLAALRAPMDCRDALLEKEIDRLLDPGYLPAETGFCVFPDGGAYVASLVRFPNVPIEAMRWWWWWHSVESERYTLWHPWAHVSVERDDADAITRPGLSDEARYVGSRHTIREFIGSRRVDILIDFRAPGEFGLDEDRIRRDGVVHGCGWVSLRRPRVRVVRMIHLARPTEDGFELRSRYWIARDLSLAAPWGDVSMGGKALARLNAGRLLGIAHDQLLHDQSEFTHLAGFLGPLHAQFGRSHEAGSLGS